MRRYAGFSTSTCLPAASAASVSVEMKARRDGDDDGIDRRVVDRRRVVRVAAGAAVVAAEGVRLRAIAARVAAGDLAPQRLAGGGCGRG